MSNIPIEKSSKSLPKASRVESKTTPQPETKTGQPPKASRPPASRESETLPSAPDRAERVLAQRSSTAQDRQASKAVTSQQARLSSLLTGPAALEAANRSPDSAAPARVFRDPDAAPPPSPPPAPTVRPEAPDPETLELLSPQERRLALEHYHNLENEYLESLPAEERETVLAGDAAERVMQAEGSEARLDAIQQELKAGVDPTLLLESVGPEFFGELQQADAQAVTDTVVEISQLVADNEEAAAVLAQQLADTPPANFVAVVKGLALSSADENSEFGLALAQVLEERESPVAGQIRQAASVESYAKGVAERAAEGGLPNSLAATEYLTASIDGAPPEVVAVLLKELEENGSLETITTALADTHRQVDSSDTYYGLGHPMDFVIDFLAPTDGQEISPTEAFDRVVAQLSNAVFAAGDEEATSMVAGLIADGIGDNVGRFDESFEVMTRQGFGIELAGAVAKELHGRGNEGVSAKIVEGIERGADVYIQRFDQVADKVDSANGDLGYLLTEWGPFYGNSDDGKLALQEEIDAFQTAHPEYAQLDHMSRYAPGMLEELHDLQELFPNKDHLKAREAELLGEIPRFGATPTGSAALAEAVFMKEAGETTFLDRLNDKEVIGRIIGPRLNLHNFDQAEEIRDTFIADVQQQVASSGVKALVEAALQGDEERLAQLRDGMIHNAESLGVSPSDLEGVIDATLSVRTAALELGDTVGLDPGLGVLTRQAEELQRAAADLPAGMRNRFLAAGATLGLLSSGISWAGADGGGALDISAAALSTVGDAFGVGELASTLRHNTDLAKVFSKGANVLGAVIDGIGLFQAAQEGNLVDVGIKSLSFAGSIAALGGHTGVGLLIAGGAAILELGYAQYKKVEASNHFESEEAERFIRRALEVGGFEGADIDAVTNHLRNADDEGRQTGILIQQAAQRAGMEPIELLLLIAEQDPDTILDIVEAGHGVDPTGKTLDSLPQAAPGLDDRVGTGGLLSGPRTVEGFLIYLEQKGILER